MPKFIMANGKLVKALLHTGVTRYMDFRAVDGSYVVRKGAVKKVPATDAEALTSDLVGFFDKRRLRNFFMCAAARPPRRRTRAAFGVGSRRRQRGNVRPEVALAIMRGADENLRSPRRCQPLQRPESELGPPDVAVATMPPCHINLCRRRAGQQWLGTTFYLI